MKFFHLSYADEVSVGDEVSVYETNRLIPTFFQLFI